MAKDALKSAIRTGTDDAVADANSSAFALHTRTSPMGGLARTRLRVAPATSSTEVVIVGAGPYGLSLAAHLRSRNIRFRIFGRAMESWRERMPAGMLLKSEGCASSLHDPEGRFTLKHFCRQRGLPYQDTGLPVPLKTLVAYGCWFQEQLVPDLQDSRVTAVEQAANGFRLQLDNGETITARKVIVAVGNHSFRSLPPELGQLPPEFLSHSSDHHDLSRFKNLDVSVIGGGASALDVAALLHEAGAQVRLIVRNSAVRFTPQPQPRSRWERIRHPQSALGVGWRGLFFSEAPMVFHHLPERSRLRMVKQHFGPSGGWPMKERVVGRVPLLLSCQVNGAEVRDGRVSLQVTDATGTRLEIATDHIIAATGYQVDLRRLPFLSEKVMASVRTIEAAPVLSRNFESSLPGLYFTGLAAANEFGPAMRFMYGARYTARRLSEHLIAVVGS